MAPIGAWFGRSTIGMKALVALACVVVLVSSGCSAEQPNHSSGSHREPNKPRGPARDEARSEAPETTTEAAKLAPKKAAGQSDAKTEPKPESKPKPKRKPAPSQGPKPVAPTTNTVRPAHATVMVSNVIDVDTIKISPAVNGLKDVRLIGVDTPETVDPSEGGRAIRAAGLRFRHPRACVA